QRDELTDLLDRKPEVASSPDEPQGVNVARVVVAVTGIPTGSRRDEADLLVMPDHPLADPGSSRGFADLHSRTLRSRSELPMTATELKAIAAPAMIGLRRRPNQG